LTPWRRLSSPRLAGVTCWPRRAHRQSHPLSNSSRSVQDVEGCCDQQGCACQVHTRCLRLCKQVHARSCTGCMPALWLISTCTTDCGTGIPVGITCQAIRLTPLYCWCDVVRALLCARWRACGSSSPAPQARACSCPPRGCCTPGGKPPGSARPRRRASTRRGTVSTRGQHLQGPSPRLSAPQMRSPIPRVLVWVVARVVAVLWMAAGLLGMLAARACGRAQQGLAWTPRHSLATVMQCLQILGRACRPGCWLVTCDLYYCWTTVLVHMIS
jgi:hypothetical protein